MPGAAAESIDHLESRQTLTAAVVVPSSEKIIRMGR